MQAYRVAAMHSNDCMNQMEHYAPEHLVDGSASLPIDYVKGRVQPHCVDNLKGPLNWRP